MTEREKMLAGLPYDCGDAELLALWHRAKDLTRDYNRTDSADAREKDRILSELLGGQGERLWITAPFYVDYGVNLFFGDNCEVNMNCTFLDDNVIRIGDNALIAPNVQIYTAFHPANAADRFGAPRADAFAFCKTRTAPVVVGDNVWIGGGAILLPGVTIGDNAVIGAGSVVTGDIPANSVALGNPCRVVRANGPHGYGLREVRRSDLPHVAEIYNSNLDFLARHLGVQRVDEAFAAQEAEAMRAAGFRPCVIVDRAAAEVLGVLDYRPGGEVYLSLLMLAAGAQGKGAGRAVYAAFEERMAREGARSVRIDVVDDCEGSLVPFWQRLGFAGSEHVQLRWGEKESRALVMRKELKR